jgi:predicted phage terminase large subunit-like protein
MHNLSRELIVFTRWHEEDLIGRIARRERVVQLNDWSQIASIGRNDWLHLNFEALKESLPTALDPRAEGEALWPEQQDTELLTAKRRLDAARFECMYQGHPAPQGGLLYGEGFACYDELPREVVRWGNYTDTADMGDDYLCSICYAVDVDGVIYVTDVVYSREPMEVTEREVAEMLCRNRTRTATIESNNGGRGFARAVQRMATTTKIEWFHQSGNKEARILSHSATAVHLLRFPKGWQTRWRDLYQPDRDVGWWRKRIL